MDELQEAGLTRHVGVSNFTPSLLDEARDLLDAADRERIAAIEETRRLFDRDRMEWE